MNVNRLEQEAVLCIGSIKRASSQGLPEGKGEGTVDGLVGSLIDRDWSRRGFDASDAPGELISRVQTPIHPPDTAQATRSDGRFDQVCSLSCRP